MPEHNIPYVNIAAQADEQMADLLPIIERVVRRGSYVGNEEEVAGLEKRLAEYCEVKEVVALNSGTDALYLSMKVAGIGPGDEVITPPNSFVASTATIVQTGATPVFADVLPDQNIDPAAIERAITPRTRGIMPVHLTGRVCRMDAIMEIAHKHKLIVLRMPLRPSGRPIRGARPDRSATSDAFPAIRSRTSTLSEMPASSRLITKKPPPVCGKLRNHGMADRATIEEWGLVSRLDVLQAAILNYRLDKLPDVIARRRENAALYQKPAEASEDLRAAVAPGRVQHISYFRECRSSAAMSSESICAGLGIKTAIHYPIPIHLQPAASNLGYKKGDFPASELQADRILTLPVNQYMSLVDVEIGVEGRVQFYGG